MLDHYSGVVDLGASPKSRQANNCRC